MASKSFHDRFQSVNEWCNKGGGAAGFPTCEEKASADPYISNHGVVILRYTDISLANPTAAELGVDPSIVEFSPETWRDVFTAANLYAHAHNALHGFPTFQRTESSDGRRFWVVLVRGSGPGPVGNGITWRDIPAEELFPEVGAGASWFLSLPPQTWMQRLDAWALAHDQGAALPTGWTANYAGKWVIGAVLFEPSAVSRVLLSGEQLDYYPEVCGKESNWPVPATTTGSVHVIASSEGLAPPAPLAIDEAPFGDPLYAEPFKVDYFRCVARRTGRCVVAVFAKGPDGVQMDLRPRADNRRLVYFGNGTGSGTWIVAHRFNSATQEGDGEVVSYYRGPGEGQEVAFELTPQVAGPGQIQAHTIGFVKQGILGIALPIMSFAYSTFLRLSPGMDLRFNWVTPE